MIDSTRDTQGASEWMTLEEAIKPHPKINPLLFGDPMYPYKEQHKLMSPFDSKGHGILEKSYEAPPQKNGLPGTPQEEEYGVFIYTRNNTN